WSLDRALPATAAYFDCTCSTIESAIPLHPFSGLLLIHPQWSHRRLPFLQPPVAVNRLPGEVPVLHLSARPGHHYSFDPFGLAQADEMASIAARHVAGTPLGETGEVPPTGLDHHLGPHRVPMSLARQLDPQPVVADIRFIMQNRHRLVEMADDQ